MTAWTVTRSDRARSTRCWRCGNTDQTPCHTDRRWEIGITHRGWRSDRAQIVLRPGACRATVETNADDDLEDRDPRTGGARRTALLYRGACLGCGWAGPVRRNNENAAVDDAHDHALPGWRDLPMIARHAHDATATIVEQWALEVETMYAAHGFDPNYGPRGGGVIRTVRTPNGTRSHHVTGLDIYDVYATSTASSAAVFTVEQLTLFP